MWTKLDRYIFSEIHSPFAMAMLVYNGIFFIRTFTEVAQLTGDVEFPFWLYLLLFVSYIPGILYMTIPMSFLFGALAAISRMSSDSEMIAPQTAGMSFFRLNRPIFVYGSLLTLVLFALTNWLEPKMIELRHQKYAQFIDQMARPNLIAGVINTLGQKSVMYMDRVDGEKARDLIFINQEDGQEHLMYAADILVYKEPGKGIRIKLSNGNEKIIELEDQRGVRIAEFKGLRMDFPSPTSKAEEKFRGEPHDSMATPAAFAHLKSLGGTHYLKVKTELLMRLFVPFACLLFSLFPIPFAAQHTRLRKGSGFGLSLMMIAIYFLLAKIGSGWVLTERLSPLLATALPSILFVVWGTWLQFRKNGKLKRTLPSPGETIVGLLGGAMTRLKRMRRRGVRDSLRLTTTGWRGFTTAGFPRLIDLYIIRQFVALFILVQGSIMALFALIEYTQIAQQAEKNQIPLETVLQYLLYKAPEVFEQTLFFAMMITVLAVLAIMSKSQEVTAVRASGGSLQRLAMPLLFLGLLASFLSLYLSNSFLPSTSRIATNLRYTIKNRNVSKFGRDAWLKTPGGDLINFEYFDQGDQRIHGASFYEVDYAQGGVMSRIYYPKLAYHNKNQWEVETAATGWRFERGDSNSLKPLRLNVEPGSIISLDVDRSDLSQRDRKPMEFSLGQLRAYIDYLTGLGLNPLREQTEYYARMVQPALPLVLVMLAIPFGFQFGRRGTFYGVAIGLIVGLGFWTLFELAREMGRNGVLPPVVAAWSAFLLFATTAWIRFIQMDS